MAEVRAIAARANPLLVRLRKLAAEPAAYRKHGELWLEGDHLCAAFLQRGGVAPQAVITEEGWSQPALQHLASRAQNVAVVPAALMEGLSGLESPPALGFAVPWAGAGTLLPGAPSVVLDRLQDPGNVGTILRSAAAFGFTQVLAIKGTAALWSPRVLRAGMGAHFGLRLLDGVGLDAVAQLQVPLLVTSSHQGASLLGAARPWPCAWVFGHEGQGVAPALAARAAHAVRIEQPGGEESLNVAAAAAICLHASAAGAAAQAKRPL